MPLHGRDCHYPFLKDILNNLITYVVRGAKAFITDVMHIAFTFVLLTCVQKTTMLLFCNIYKIKQKQKHE